MAISLTSVVGFKTPHVSRSSIRASAPWATQFTTPLSILGSRQHKKKRRRGLCLSIADGDRIATDTSTENSEVSIRSSSNNQTLDSPGENRTFQTSVDDTGPQTSEAANGSVAYSDSKQDESSSPNLQPTPKRSPLTARERLRAARVLSRYNETKVSKSEMGSKVLDALMESDKGKKRSGLPEAPTNLFDDSKRGMPKQGLTFDFPGGADLFIIAFSFVFISTVMFATTYIVWKVGAIHFNEY